MFFQSAAELGGAELGFGFEMIFVRIVLMTFTVLLILSVIEILYGADGRV